MNLKRVVGKNVAVKSQKRTKKNLLKVIGDSTVLRKRQFIDNCTETKWNWPRKGNEENRRQTIIGVVGKNVAVKSQRRTKKKNFLKVIGDSTNREPDNL